MASLDQPAFPRPYGPYTLLRRVAVGGMAEVFVAAAPGFEGFEKLVALKLVHTRYAEDPGFVRMLVDEAKLSVLLSHGNIVQTFDLVSVEGRYGIVLEYIDGLDLGRLLERVNARDALLPIEAALYIVHRVCQALDYAHRKTDADGSPLHIIHRDVSPQNVLLSREGEVKLTDFGIAKAALRASDTEVGVIKGKYCYMSPEQAWADPIDHRSDVFAAGAVLYEVLTGKMLHSPDENVLALLERVRSARVDPPSCHRPEISPELDAIVMRALAEKRDDRYASAADFAYDLERALWELDRTWGPSKLRKLLDEYASTETGMAHRELGAGRVTGDEFRIGRMSSRDFTPNRDSSVLYAPAEPQKPARRSGSLPPRAGVLEVTRPSTRPDPRVDGDPSGSTRLDSFPKAPRIPDLTVPQTPSVPVPLAPNPDEVTTAPGEPRPSATTGPIRNPPTEFEAEEPTLVDRSGQVARQLNEMISLGGARPAMGAVFDSSPKIVPFVPPRPAWAPIPFVGPPLDDGGSDALAPTSVSHARAVLWVATLAVAVAALAAVAAHFAH